MARIRTIKPEMWQDEKLAPLPPISRLVFVGLISMADDAGRVIDSVRAINGFMFPETDDSAADSIDTLVELGLLERGLTGSGQKILQISKWHHQKIDKPNLSSALPPIVILDESSARRRKIPDKVRQAIIARDGGVCRECGVVVRPGKNDKYDAGPDLAEIDHILPVKDGGTNDPQNLRTLCLSCNRKKAGSDVRRRNKEASAKGRGNVDDVSTPHISTSISTNDLVSTINDHGSSSCSEPSHATASEPDVAMEFVCVGGEKRGFVSADQLTQWTTAYPGVDVMAELRKMRSWLDANQEKRKTAKGLPRFIVMWLGKAQDRSGGSNGGPSNQPRRMSAGEITQQNIDKMLGRAVA